MLCKLLLVESGTQRMAIFQKDWINVTKWVQVSLGLINNLFIIILIVVQYYWLNNIKIENVTYISFYQSENQSYELSKVTGHMQ